MTTSPLIPPILGAFYNNDKKLFIDMKQATRYRAEKYHLLIKASEMVEIMC